MTSLKRGIARRLRALAERLDPTSAQSGGLVVPPLSTSSNPTAYSFRYGKP